MGRIRKPGNRVSAVLGVMSTCAILLFVFGASSAFATATPTGDIGGASNSFSVQVGTSTGTILVGTFTDSDLSCDITGPSDFSATINWGDGTTSAATIDACGVNGSPAEGGNIYGSHTYGFGGLYNVTIDFTDTDEGTVSLNDGGTGTTELSDGTATVFDNTGTSESFSAAEGVSTGTIEVGTFTDADGSCIANTSADFSATIHWGDGTTSAGTPVCDNSGAGPNGTITGSHTYAEEGSYAVTIDFTDGDLGSAEVPETFSGGTATVSGAVESPTNKSLTATEGAAMAASTLGTFSDDDVSPAATPGDFTVTTCWNDLPNPPNDCGSQSATSLGGGNFSVVAGHTFAEEGVYSVTTTVTDNGGPPATITTTVTVSDAALTATAVKTIQAQPKKTFSKIVANFTDADPAGTTSDYTATIHWGDGSSSSGTIAPNGLGGWSVTGAHKYALAGGYAITIDVHDSGGASASTITQARVH